MDQSRHHGDVFDGLCLACPNEQDKAYAAQFGREADGDIMFHGRSPEGGSVAPKSKDWTAGCIALTDDEIKDV